MSQSNHSTKQEALKQSSRVLTQEHTKKHPLQITTDILPSSQRPSSQPDSPISRKRAEGADDDHKPESGDRPESADNISVDSSTSSHPPLKKTKTSASLSQINLTEYRCSQEAVDDLASPQTSPNLEPVDPDSLSSKIRKDLLPSNPIIPVLGRSRTLEEFRPSPVPLTRSSSSMGECLSTPNETAIGNLSLGTSSGLTSRIQVIERAMGVITSRPGSRHGSPSDITIERRSRENTPMQVEVGSTSVPNLSTSFEDDSSFLRHYSPISEADENGESASESERYKKFTLLEESENYNEDSDEDYHSEADTTIDEDGNRLSSPEGDEDSLSDIDVNNIFTNFLDLSRIPRVPEDTEETIQEEARVHGVQYIVEKYIDSDLYSPMSMLLMTYAIEDEPRIPSDTSHSHLLGEFVHRLSNIVNHRKRLKDIHTIHHVVELLKSSKNIMVLTGAGVSVSCGIPDFRSPNGVYSRLAEFDLDDPQDMFDLEFFCHQPQTFYSFAREIYPGNFAPSPSHHFIRLLEDKGKLLRNYTQNIDTLEQKAGIKGTLNCHGSFATATCLKCKNQVHGDELKEAINQQQVAYCNICLPHGPDSDIHIEQQDNLQANSDTISSDDMEDVFHKPIMKPDIIFFGEQLPKTFDRFLEDDRNKVDLLIVMGSSLKVAPVSGIMNMLPSKVPQILINMTPITHMEFDVQLLGDCDTIVAELCRLANWELVHDKLPGGSSNVVNMEGNANLNGSGRGGREKWSLVEPNTYLFKGAIPADIDYVSSQHIGLSHARWGGSDDHGSLSESEEIDRTQLWHDKAMHLKSIPETSAEGESSDDNQGAESKVSPTRTLAAKDTSPPVSTISAHPTGAVSGLTQQRAAELEDWCDVEDAHILAVLESLPNEDLEPKLAHKPDLSAKNHHPPSSAQVETLPTGQDSV
ncbi:NAD-dependent histone deacetylase sir2 [Lunasporangiospora selenospora]|uniref:NAD-dependent histone deacetylase sir2 n=1 Tax=Lunasporangiospora selenospora TaxID=979761 RepID=A0A9P6FXA7_9FUNG|nr:NAD-dependent histone deacetylase sir2 [Lunasporangiospora selenospora]